jgi:hypothetical protein
MYFDLQVEPMITSALRAMLRSSIVRPLAAAGFVAFLAIGLSQQEHTEFRKYLEARNGLRTLLSQAEAVYTDDQRAELDGVLSILQQNLNFWPASGAVPEIALATKNCVGALTRAQWTLDAGDVVRVSVSGGVAKPSEVHRKLPFGPGALILRVSQPDMHPGDMPDFLRAFSDGSVHLGPAQTAYVLYPVDNPAPGISQVRIPLIAQDGKTATVNVTVESPATGTLNVEISDAESQQTTPAIVGLFGARDHLFVPKETVSFTPGGFSYNPGQVRPMREARYWPGKGNERRMFVSNGEFSLTLPEGHYTLLVGKGMEYTPVRQTFDIKVGVTETQKVALKRWINMPARGWYSGDMHVHWARPNEAAGQPLMQWTQAEDVHVANVLRMGDAKETYFEQYGFGKSGQVVSGNYALVPGQEDPRTNIIGHTLHLRLQSPVRDTERYYLFSRVFDEVARQGGFNGYAHMQQPNAFGFFVRRSMSLEVPRGKTDFFEISEFGNIGEETYYEFLNLGFPLTAGAGSDVPWGNTIGTSRVYAYVGPSFTPDAWYDALRAGHTFVTTGPMLDFTVNGQLPGSVITAHAGDTLRIKASVEGGPVEVAYLEVVEQGGVVRTVQQKGRRMALEFTVPVHGSTWIAARCDGGHTTPVYIKVGNQRFWKRSEAQQLILNRLNELNQIAQQLHGGMPDANLGNWDNDRSLMGHREELKQELDKAEAFYQAMLAEAKR